VKRRDRKSDSENTNRRRRNRILRGGSGLKKCKEKTFAEKGGKGETKKKKGVKVRPAIEYYGKEEGTHHVMAVQGDCWEPMGGGGEVNEKDHVIHDKRGKPRKKGVKLWAARSRFSS